MLLGRLQDRRDRLLDAEVHHGVAVVGQDDVDQVLADVVHVALDGGEHDRALAGRVGLLQMRLEVGDGALHHLRGLQHERQLHLSGPEQLADHLHPGQQVGVDDLQRRLVVQGQLEVVGQPLALAVDDPALQPLGHRQREQLGGPLGLGVGGRDALEQFEEALQRVVPLPAPVVDHVEGDVALLFRDPRHRHDLRGMHDRGVQSGLDALVEEHRVQHDPGRRVESEGDVGQAERGLDLGVEPLDLTDGLDGLDAVAAGLLLAGGDREGQRVDDDVARSACPSSWLGPRSAGWPPGPSIPPYGPGPPRRWSRRSPPRRVRRPAA